MDNKMKFEIKLVNLEPVNPTFSKAKAYIMYHGDNRNKSSITKEVVEANLHTLFNCPVIGEYNESIEDFKGHGGKIEISDEGVKYIQTTRPYGLIPESTTFAWETVVEDDGTEHEYLTCTVYIWTGRYPEAMSIIENGKGQSMEIEEVEGNFRDDGYFDIKSFIFSALCILGDNTEPCFESASLVAYSLDKDTFRSEFEQMVKELKYSLSQSTPSNDEQNDGGAEMQTNTVEFNNENLENLDEQDENLGTNEEEFSSDENQNEEEAENFEQNLDKDDNNKNDNNSKFTVSFELSHEDLRSKIYDKLNTSDTNEHLYRYYIIATYSEYVIIGDWEESDKYFKIPYEINENDEITLGSWQEVKMTWTPVNETNDDIDLLSELNMALSTLNTKYNDLQLELEILRKFKADIEIEKENERKEQERIEKQTLIDEFSLALTADEIKLVKDDFEKLSINEMDAKLNKILAQKNLAKIKMEIKQDTTEHGVIVGVNKKESHRSRYAV